MPSALIVSGGWDGHRPLEVADILKTALTKEGFTVTLSTDLNSFKDAAKFDLVIPNWTMGKIEGDQVRPLLDAVEAGTGLAGLHGGMGDSFRETTDYQYMVGGQFVCHPGNDGKHYKVYTRGDSAITEGIGDFDVVSEQYYMHVDPAISPVATTVFADTGVEMPVAWTKSFGKGRVFYCSLGHAPDIVSMPQTLTMMTRGAIWAARRS